MGQENKFIRSFFNTGAGWNLHKYLNEPNFVDREPQISGKYVVWTRWESGNSEVYAHNLSEGTTFNVSNSPYYDSYAQVSGQYVVWQEIQTY